MTERNTMQKSLVYNALCTLANHPTADEIYERVHEQSPSVSRATVYRILGKLADKGAVLRIEVKNGADHFDHQTHDHYHVCCTLCGKVSDVDMPPVRDLEKQITDSSGYEITGYTVLFDGICPECTSERRENGLKGPV